MVRRTSPAALVARLTLACGLGVMLSSCGASRIETPFFTQPPQVILPSGARAEPPQVAVCYSSSTTTDAALREMVARACRDPRLVRQDMTGNCTVIQPIRATFSCTSVDTEVAKVEKPYRIEANRDRFRLDPQVVTEEPEEEKR